jgi:uncharacterized protein (DUF697 family)
MRIARAFPVLLREVQGRSPAPLLVGGPPSVVAELSRALTLGGDGALVREMPVDESAADGAEGAALVYVVHHGGLTPTDERVLREADRHRLPLVCLALGAGANGRVLPYVRTTDVVRARSIDEEAVARVAARVAVRAGEAAWALARGLPVLRRPVAEALVTRFARQNAAVGAAVFVPGADLPTLTLNELRMVLRIAAAYGLELEGTRRLALATVVGAGLGLRAIARRAVQLLPAPAFAVKGGVAYAGTRAIGEAAIALAERQVP